ncbi:MAG: AI-2E family transporter [Chloroflexota bacterium]|nr:MAG: AI-2E family transporter [Chloroflexota bacterium]
MNDEEGAFILKRVFFYLAFLLLIVLALVMLWPFLTTIIISVISVILLKPLYDYFLGTKLVKERKRLAVTLTMLSGFLIVIVPLVFVVWLSINQLTEAVTAINSQEVEAFVGPIREALASMSGSESASEEISSAMESVADFFIAAGLGIARWLGEKIQAIPVLLANGIVFLALVAAMLPLYDKLSEMSIRTSPIGRELAALYSRKIVAMVKSLVTGVFLIAIIQGLAMGVFYWLAGLNFVFLLSLISIMLAIIPMVGISWLVIFIAIVSLLNGETTQAIIVLFGFYGVVNWIDIVLRPKFISEEAHINTALFLLSMFAGLAWAGIMGLFYGPIIMLLLVTTVQVYVETFAEEDGQAIGSAVSSITARRSNSEGDDKGVTDVGEAAIPEEG